MSNNCTNGFILNGEMVYPQDGAYIVKGIEDETITFEDVYAVTKFLSAVKSGEVGPNEFNDDGFMRLELEVIAQQIIPKGH